MSARAIIGIISICAVGTGSFLAVTFWLLILEELDRKRPGEPIYSALGFPRVGTPRIIREYLCSYPNGKLHIYVLATLALAIIGMLGLVGVGVYSIVVNESDAYRIPNSRRYFQGDGQYCHQRRYARNQLHGIPCKSYEGETRSVTWTNVPTANYSLTSKDYRLQQLDRMPSA